MNTKKFTILSYNVGCSGQLAGLKQLLDMHQPSLVFLQEISLSTEQLNAYLGLFYEGLSNVDINDQRKPATACVWLKSLDVVVSSIVLCRIQSLDYDNIKFINVYAPSGTQGQRARRRLFSQDLLTLIAASTQLPVPCEDWNCVTWPQDVSSFVAGQPNMGQPSVSYFNQKKSTELSNLIKSFRYIDAFTHQNNQVDFTWSRHGSRPSRLDRVYVPNILVNKLTKCHHIQHLSDHKAVRVSFVFKLKISEEVLSGNRGRSYWKLN